MVKVKKKTITTKVSMRCGHIPECGIGVKVTLCNHAIVHRC